MGDIISNKWVMDIVETGIDQILATNKHIRMIKIRGEVVDVETVDKEKITIESFLVVYPVFYFII